MSKSQMVHQSVRVLLAATLFVGAAFAAEMPPARETESSKEVREKMAAAHDAMAACLRSDKSLADCRNEMQMTCKQLHGEEGCPMMGTGMHQRMKKQ
jgi:hypothetical protein